MSAHAHDVFLSYNWRDHAAVEAIGRALRDQALRVFLDRWYLVPGRPWPAALEAAVGECGAVAVFLGPHGVGAWQQREKDLALDRQARDRTFPVIPVLLPGGEPALGFLGLNTWVDLHAGLDDATGLSMLAAAIRGQPPGPDFQQRLQATLAAICPYRGLRPFREEDAPFFFGRETFTERLVEALGARRLLRARAALARDGGPTRGRRRESRSDDPRRAGALDPETRGQGGARVPGRSRQSHPGRRLD